MAKTDPRTDPVVESGSSRTVLENTGDLLSFLSADRAAVVPWFRLCVLAPVAGLRAAHDSGDSAAADIGPGGADVAEAFGALRFPWAARPARDGECAQTG